MTCVCVRWWRLMTRWGRSTSPSRWWRTRSRLWTRRASRCSCCSWWTDTMPTASTISVCATETQWRPIIAVHIGSQLFRIFCFTFAWPFQFHNSRSVGTQWHCCCTLLWSRLAADSWLIRHSVCLVPVTVSKQMAKVASTQLQSVGYWSWYWFLASQPACDVSYKPGGRLPLLSARPAVTIATLKKAVTRQRCCCDLNQGQFALSPAR